MEFRFSRLDDASVREAFDILMRVGQRLELAGRKQRISKTRFGDYQQWQSEHANYVITRNEEILGVATLRRERLVDWPAWRHLKPVRMLRALATDPRYLGLGVGSFAIDNLKQLVGGEVPIYLDCVSDWLPKYYGRFGFETLDQQVREYPGIGRYDITLMRWMSCRQR